MKTFFTSDLHFGHNNIIIYDKRPFDSVEDMDQELVRRWNSKVGTEDMVYVLGDMFLPIHKEYVCGILETLNGKIILVKGNHDRFAKKEWAAPYFQDILSVAQVDVPLEDGSSQRCLLSHKFLVDDDWAKEDRIFLHGHSHVTVEADQEIDKVAELNSRGIPYRAYNVGCMYYDFYPMTLDEILRAGPKKAPDYGNRGE